MTGSDLKNPWFILQFVPLVMRSHAAALQLCPPPSSHPANKTLHLSEVRKRNLLFQLMHTRTDLPSDAKRTGLKKCENNSFIIPICDNLCEQSRRPLRSEYERLKQQQACKWNEAEAFWQRAATRRRQAKRAAKGNVSHNAPTVAHCNHPSNH